MVAGMIIVPVVSLLTPKPSGEHIDRIFACYDETVVIKKKHSLEEE
jgi:SSS family solute:Na+ symporter